ncbi:COG3904 family protein [Gymnodinialimonas sp.]
MNTVPRPSRTRPLAVLAMSLALFLAGPDPALAVEIERTGPPQTDVAAGCSLTLTGPINPGDAARVEAALDPLIAELFNYPSHLLNEQVVVCLESDGGDFLEGLRLAQLFHERTVTTRVSPNSSCISACALAFMGGRYDSRSGVGFSPSRYLHPTSRLGFHAPRLILGDGEVNRESVQQSYTAAILSIGLLAQNAQTFGISTRLIRNIVLNTGQSVHYVTTIDDVSDYGLRLYGYAPPPLTEQAQIAGCWNSFRWEFRPNQDRETLDEFWSYVSHASLTPQQLVEYYPFDGSMYCAHTVQQFGGGFADSFVQSESSNLVDPRIRMYRPSWARLPGPSPITDLRPGVQRDFF